MRDIILQVQNFVRNGGRKYKGQEPRMGEPFYAQYVQQKINSQYRPGDKIKIVVNDQIVVGILLRCESYIYLLTEGKKVWGNCQNVKEFSVGKVKSMQLLEAKKDSFNIDEIDPTNRYHPNKYHEEDDYWYKKTAYRKQCRMKNQQQFMQVYPNVPFDKSHIIVVQAGFTLYWPFHNNGITAEIYLVQGEGTKVEKIPCKVKTPYPNKNSYHAFNCKEAKYDDCMLYTYLPDCHVEYQNINLICVWKIKTMINGSSTEVHIIHIDHIEKIEPAVDERNIHITDMSTTTLLGFGNDLFTKKSFVLEELMDFDAMFLLNSDENTIISIKGSQKDKIYSFLAQQAIGKSSLEGKKMPVVEVFVDKDNVLEGYYSDSWRNCRSTYKFKANM